uniref:MFS transporter n=1 Tax=Strongyloides papillosus TaxID=174720 RepID=A0A0N5C0V3_STREA
MRNNETKLVANKENLNFIWWDKFITFYGRHVVSPLVYMAHDN